MGKNGPKRLSLETSLPTLVRIVTKNSTVHIVPCTVTEKSAQRAAFETFNFAMDPRSFPTAEE